MKKLIALLFLLTIFSCEKYSSDGCCWVCRVSNTQYYPHQQPNKVKIWLEYDSLFCDCTDDVIQQWEKVNTWSDTLNGVWTEQIATCVKGVQ